METYKTALPQKNRPLAALSVELKKGRYRRLALVPLGFLAALFVWAAYAHKNPTPEETAQGYTYLFFQLPLLNCVLMPIMIAVIASRLCDMEIKGQTLKLLYTLEEKSSFYDWKFFHEFLYLLLFCLGEALLFPLFGQLFHFTETLSFLLLFRHTVCTLLAGFAVLTLQHVLSLMAENQIMPLFLGLIGSFLGLFSMFFPRSVANLILWGYFGAFLPFGMDYDSASRTTTFYPVAFPTVTFLLFAVFCIAFYAVCRRIFLNKEV